MEVATATPAGGRRHRGRRWLGGAAISSRCLRDRPALDRPYDDREPRRARLRYWHACRRWRPSRRRKGRLFLPAVAGPGNHPKPVEGQRWRCGVKPGRRCLLGPSGASIPGGTMVDEPRLDRPCARCLAGHSPPGRIWLKATDRPQAGGECFILTAPMRTLGRVVSDGRPRCGPACCEEPRPARRR